MFYEMLDELFDWVETYVLSSSFFSLRFTSLHYLRGFYQYNNQPICISYAVSHDILIQILNCPDTMMIRRDENAFLKYSSE